MRKSTEVKRYLRQIKVINISLKHKMTEIEELWKTATDINAVSYDSEKVTASRKSTDAVYVNDILRINDLEKKIKDEILRLTEKKHEIISGILSMENEIYSHILIMHYVDMKSFEDIAAETDYSYQYVINLHRKAINAFAEIYYKKDIKNDLSA